MKRQFRTILRFSVFTLAIPLALLCFSSVIFADTQNFSSSDDSYLQSGSPNANNGSATVMDLNNTRDGVIRFDLSAIPSGSTVNSATLTLVATAVGSATAIKNYGAHRILADWIESTVTWNTPGSTAGTHFASSPTQTTSISAVGSYDWDVTGDVVNFVNGSSTNYGWRIIWSSNTSGTNKQIDFGTKENGTVSNRPVLTVVYTPSVAPDVSVPIVPSDGGILTRPVTVVFSGRAFPDAKLFVMDKDIRFVDRTANKGVIANENGDFQVSFINISEGPHSFGLLIKDKDNRTTQTKFFNINTLVDGFVVKDILVPPTIGILQRLVSRGQPAVIVGSASPKNGVVLEVDDTIKREANVERDGSYKVAVDTSSLEFGTHHVRVKQIDAKKELESDYSPTNDFVVSRLIMPKMDLSGDGMMNIKDWSVFLFAWGAKDESQKKLIDFNNDGKVNISDFSMFIRTIKK